MPSGLRQRASTEDQGQAKTLQGDNETDQPVDKCISPEQLRSRRREIPQISDRSHDSRNANCELLQQRRDAQVDLGINREVSTLAIAGRFVVVQLDDDFLQWNG